MRLPELCIRRPVMTSLLMLSFIMCGIFGYRMLPVASLPEIDYPTISITANLPGASPETMATSVATPIERELNTIAGITEMTSSSTQGSTNINVQFGLDRNLDGAAQDVQSALSSVARKLPPELPTPPTIKKVNPTDQAMIQIIISSPTLQLTQLNDYIENMIIPRLAIVSGIGDIQLNGSQRFAIRIEIKPDAMSAAGIALEDIRTAIAAANSRKPVGGLDGPKQSLSLDASGSMQRASDYRSMIVRAKDGVPVRLGDVANVIESVEYDKRAAWLGDTRAIAMQIRRTPGANLVEVVDGIKALIPSLREDLPASVHLTTFFDRSLTIKRAVHDVQFTLMFAISLVVLIMFLFLRNVSATAIPAAAVPVSLLGTCAVMYVCHFSIDNISLLAITLSVGFVVDDAIVMLENIVRHMEAGETRWQAALRGSREIGFTILSITISLIAVFIPVLFMGGIVGRLFREFAVTIGSTIVISGMVSLTLTPMLCSRILPKPRHGDEQISILRWSEAAFEWLINSYKRTLDLALSAPRVILAITFISLVASAVCYAVIPKGFFPTEDTGIVSATVEGSQDMAFDQMVILQRQAAAIAATDPDIIRVSSTVDNPNTGRLQLELKDFGERSATTEQVLQRLRPKLAQIPGINVYLRIPPTIQVGTRSARSTNVYTLRGPDFDELQKASLALVDRLRNEPGFQDVNSDLQVNLPQVVVDIDREKAGAMNVTVDHVRDTLYGSFGTQQISTIFTPSNDYQVILEVDPAYRQDMSALSAIYVRSTTGALVPLGAIATLRRISAANSINHLSQLPAITISFGLAPGIALGDAVNTVTAVQRDLNFPASISGSYQGSAQIFQESLKGQGILLMAAIFAIYVVLGILYESFIHPITILSGLPAAGTGAMLTLMLVRMDFNVISIIGLVMLIGIVKKNAIMMLDFAIEHQRSHHVTAKVAIREACHKRFRPIMMTTMATIFGTLPIALGTGAGSELRRPLGVTVVGGLILSQFLTLYITPVIFVYLDRLRERFAPAKIAEEDTAPAE